MTAPWHQRRRVELAGIVARSRQVVLLAAITGVVTGLAVTAFDEAVNEIRDPIVDRPGWVVALVPTLGLAVAALALRLGRTTPGTADEYLHAFHDDRHPLGLRAAVARMVAAVATLGSGAPMGLEGPSLYLGATLGSRLQRAFRRLTRGADTRLLMVAGAAAGVSAIFKAPATGAVFAIEVPYQDDVARRMLLPALVASGSGYVTFVTFEGTNPILPVDGAPGFAAKDLAASLVVGLLAGLGARSFAWLVRRAKALTVTARAPLRVLGAGAALASCFALGRLVTENRVVLGSGYPAIKWALAAEETVWVVIAVLVLRCVATAATIAGGGVGGVFIPLVVAGALAGRVVAEIADPDQMSLFVVVGVAAFLGAGYRVPLAAVMFVAETTGRPGFVVPGLLAAVVAELLMARSAVTTYQRLPEGPTEPGDLADDDDVAPREPGQRVRSAGASLVGPDARWRGRRSR